MNSAAAVRRISECFIKPPLPSNDTNPICYLSPWDLLMLSAHYIQKGLLFLKPSQNHPLFIDSLLHRLKRSLSLTLLHFYPLSGRLVTTPLPSYSVYVDYDNSDGARFIYATLDMAVSDILSPVDVPRVVQSFFDHDRAVNHDGHTRPLLSVQVTELRDGVFIGCSMNHCLADGTSYWKFLNAWSQVFRALEGDKFDSDGVFIPISPPPIHNRWFPEGCGPLINLPFKHHDEFIGRLEAPHLRERIFHFTAESIAILKAMANRESNTPKISSFQSLSALVWRCITRARSLPRDQRTSCRLAANNRSRMEPPLPEEYFGNCIHALAAETTSGELLEHDLGWAAWKLHAAVANHDGKAVDELVNKWLESPIVVQPGQFFDPYSVMMGSSPRFDMYGNEFGMGKAVGVRSGYANKFDGKVTSYPAREGGGSVELEICLPPVLMTALESDDEFLNSVSLGTCTAF